VTSGAELLTGAREESRAVPSTDRLRRHVRIAPTAGWPRVNWSELWESRGLFLFLVWRDVKVRYAQTVLGAAWAVFQPVITMVVFTVIFGRLVRVGSEGVPYPMFSLAALVPWTYFASALSGASNSLVNSRHLITKIYFPRLVIPGAAVLSSLVDFAIAFGVLLLVMMAYGWYPGLSAAAIIPLLLLIMMVALGTGCWLSALNIQYRDVKYTTGFLVQVWMYASPIVYPLSLVPPAYRLLYAVNPIASAVAGFRAALLGTPSPSVAQFGVSFATATLLLVGGVLYFRRTERVFADVA
jgi:lipopolysaccharide transport system permease protein